MWNDEMHEYVLGCKESLTAVFWSTYVMIPFVGSFPVKKSQPEKKELPVWSAS